MPTMILLVACRTPAKSAKKSKRGSAIIEKEVVALCKHKPVVAVMAPHKKKKINTKIIESNSDNDDDDKNFLASCDKALRHDHLNI